MGKYGDDTGELFLWMIKILKIIIIIRIQNFLSKITANNKLTKYMQILGKILRDE